jgi:hypothetical protein
MADAPSKPAGKPTPPRIVTYDLSDTERAAVAMAAAKEHRSVSQWVAMACRDRLAARGEA